MQNTTGDSPKADQVNDPSRVAASSPLPLPTEIMLQILGEALKLPNGAHSDRWSAIKQARVDKFSLVNKDMSALVPEAFYKSNKVVIKARNTIKLSEVPILRPEIKHPNVEQSQFVRELEFQPHLWNHWTVTPKHDMSYISHQVAWLEKLASGTLGFSRLDMLRIVLVNDNHDPSVDEVMQQFIGLIEEIGPLTFSAKRLEIVVDGHICSQDNCAYYQTPCRKVPCGRFPGSWCNEGTCNKHKQLSKLLLAKSRD